MLLPANEMVRAAPPVYSELSNRNGNLTLVVPSTSTILLIPLISTIFAGKITIAAKSVGGANSSIILRKYYMSGNAFVEETFPLVNNTDTVFTSITPLESAEVYIRNNDIANAITAYGEIIARVQ